VAGRTGSSASNWRQSANVRVFAELRLQTTPTRFRIPDVVAIDRNAPDEQIVTHPPLLCVEILSPEDRMPRMQEKIEEYFRMGVRAVWIIDPRTQTGYQCTGPSLQEWRPSSTLAVPGTPIQLEIPALLADLD
jgi:Uma2 family endonuclease